MSKYDFEDMIILCVCVAMVLSISVVIGCYLKGGM